MRHSRGFTLVEVMIVVAIIATIVAIALPAYQDYTIRGQLTAGLADISGGKSTFESQIVANNATTFNVNDLGLHTSTPRCDITMNPSSTDGFIRCTLKGHPRIAGKTIEIARNSAGSWHCSLTADIAIKYRPAGCT